MCSSNENNWSCRIRIVEIMLLLGTFDLVLRSNWSGFEKHVKIDLKTNPKNGNPNSNKNYGSICLRFKAFGRCFLGDKFLGKRYESRSSICLNFKKGQKTL